MSAKTFSLACLATLVASVYLQMSAKTFSLVCLTTLVSSVVLYPMQGRCNIVTCLVGMMRCSRKADAVGEYYESYGCCDIYFDCVKACGIESAT